MTSRHMTERQKCNVILDGLDRLSLAYGDDGDDTRARAVRSIRDQLQSDAEIAARLYDFLKGHERQCPQCHGVGYFGHPSDGQNCKACRGSGVALDEIGQPA